MSTVNPASTDLRHTLTLLDSAYFLWRRLVAD
jgi:hypothetical protein